MSAKLSNQATNKLKGAAKLVMYLPSLGSLVPDPRFPITLMVQGGGGVDSGIQGTCKYRNVKNVNPLSAISIFQKVIKTTVLANNLICRPATITIRNMHDIPSRRNC